MSRFKIFNNNGVYVHRQEDQGKRKVNAIACAWFR